ncbi:YceD family protein [Flavobacterium sp. TMP13]|uniref:YceD family protein n=1 Tax=Flavobacterium sp. TMP13 TaxID=3425950 RepID=UPI003D774ED4
MSKIKEFLIPFAGLKLGKHNFEYQINNKFFESFDFNEFQDADVKVSLVFDKKSSMLELSFKHKGTVNVPCDLTGEDFDLPIKGKMNLIVRFGDELNNDNEELLILPHGEFELDVMQYIYEMIVLSVPQKRIHTGIKDGTLQSDVLDKLAELTVKEQKEESTNEEDIDPRWDKLKKLLTDK